MNELKGELNKLATVNGQVRAKYGVDWIVLSPEEREYFVYLAELRRQRELAKSRS